MALRYKNDVLGEPESDPETSWLCHEHAYELSAVEVLHASLEYIN